MILLFTRLKKAVKGLYDYFFSTPIEETPKNYTTTSHDFSNVVQFVPREKIIRPLVSAPIPKIEIIPEQKEEKTNLKEEYRIWSQNMREYDKIKQRLAQ
jgi:hypothetical protein